MAENPFFTYVYIQFRIGFFTPKRPLNPRLARKNKGADRGSYLVLWQKFIPHVCLYTVPNRIFHHKTTSDSPLSSKNKGRIRGHILFVVKFIPHVCLYTVPNRIFHHKTTSDSPLSSKKEIGLSGHISRF